MAKIVFQTSAVNPAVTHIFQFLSKFVGICRFPTVGVLKSVKVEFHFLICEIDHVCSSIIKKIVKIRLNRKYMLRPCLEHLSETLFWSYLLNHLRYRPEIFTQNTVDFEEPFKKSQIQDPRKIIFSIKKNWFSFNFWAYLTHLKRGFSHIFQSIWPTDLKF